MSTKSELSTICLVACAKRASSRSTGGMLKKPGRYSRTLQSKRKATARTWLAVTTSIRRTSRLPGLTRFFGSRGAPNRGRAKVSAMGFRIRRNYRRDNHLGGELLKSHDNCARGASGVNHCEARKTGPGRIDQSLPAPINLADRHAVDQHCHGQHATRN